MSQQVDASRISELKDTVAAALEQARAAYAGDRLSRVEANALTRDAGSESPSSIVPTRLRTM